MPVTHEMIAGKLGINRTTVTKALKGDTSIRKNTRKKVIEAAALMGYDFKQSQQNRREGTRYFVLEDVNFRIIEDATGEEISSGGAILTNLSTTGAMIQLRPGEMARIPLRHFHLDIQYPDEGVMKSLPRARIVRITFYANVEMGTKFLDGSGLSLDFLKSFEARSFSKIKSEVKSEP